MPPRAVRRMRRARYRGAHGRARHDLRRDGEGWAWGQLDADGYVGWLPVNALRAPRRRRRPTRSRRCARSCSPGRSIKVPPVDGPPLGCRLAVAARRRSLARSRDAGGFVPARHLAPLERRRAGFRRGRRALHRRAVSVGRQDQPRPRLLRPGAGRAHRVRHRLPARQRHAGARARRRRHRADSPLCGAAISCSGRAMWRSCATRDAASTPTRSTWRSRSSRSARRSRASARRAAT